MLVLSGKPWSIQAINMWLQQSNTVPCYGWTLGAYKTLDYWIGVDVLGMLEETYKDLLQDGFGKYEDIMTG